MPRSDNDELTSPRQGIAIGGIERQSSVTPIPLLRRPYGVRHLVFWGAGLCALALALVASFDLSPRAKRMGSDRIVEAQMQNIGQAIDLFRYERKHIPSSLEQLTQSTPDSEPLYESIPIDPWGTTFAYNTYKDGDLFRFRLSSAGPNQRHGDEDDSVYPAN